VRKASLDDREQRIISAEADLKIAKADHDRVSQDIPPHLAATFCMAQHGPWHYPSKSNLTIIATFEPSIHDQPWTEWCYAA